MEVKIRRAEVIEILMKHLVIVFPGKKIIETTGTTSIPNEFTFEVSEPEEEELVFQEEKKVSPPSETTGNDRPDWAKDILAEEN